MLVIEQVYQSLGEGRFYSAPKEQNSLDPMVGGFELEMQGGVLGIGKLIQWLKTWEY